MPLIKPEVQQVLRKAGLLDEDKSGAEGTFTDGLNSAGLTNEAIAEELVGLALRSSNEALRLRALEIVMKARGTLKEAPVQVPNFTVIIQSDGQDLTKTRGIAPHLFPRQSLLELQGQDSSYESTCDESEQEQVN